MSRPPPASSPRPEPSPSTAPGSLGGSPARNTAGFQRRPAKPTANPRRVVGGIRSAARKPEQVPWVVQRWMRLAETYAPGKHLAEGLEYARLGQTRSLDLAPGLITARVQGRLPKAYSVAIRLPTFSNSQWEPVIDAMLAQARYAASLLAGEVPAGIEDLFIPSGLRLFPSELSDLAVSCDCAAFAPATPPAPRESPLPGGQWCKHICCIMSLVADRLASDPFLIFVLRAMPKEDLLDRLRQRRAAAGSARAASGPVQVYTPHLPGIADLTHPPLEQTVASFWTAGDALASLDLPVEPPEVPHPLLRRLGASPCPGARFPLVGLLATCYDLLSQDALRAAGTAPTLDESSSEPRTD
jgi:uncharacterized Zn finger protein